MGQTTKTLTYVDACILIGAWKARESTEQNKAWDLVFCEHRTFIGSPLLKLETIPHAKRNNNTDEVEFYEYFFDRVETWIPLSEPLEEAMRLCEVHPLGNADAIHAASSKLGGALQFVTSEKRTKPFHSVSDINPFSISDPTFVV